MLGENVLEYNENEQMDDDADNTDGNDEPMDKQDEQVTHQATDKTRKTVKQKSMLKLSLDPTDDIGASVTYSSAKNNY